MDKPRHRRIEAELQRALSELISRGVKDPRVGSVTITDVKVAADLSSRGVDEIKAEVRMEEQMAEDALSKFEIELGLKTEESAAPD